MLEDLHLALSRPLELVAAIHAANPTLDGLEERVSKHFSNLFEDPATLAQIPAVTSCTTKDTLPFPGSLVRFRAMVQDNGMGSEIYAAVGKKGDCLMYGKEESITNINSNTDGDDLIMEDTSIDLDPVRLRERETFYIVSVPGETNWFKEKVEGSSRTTDPLEVQIDALSISNSQKQQLSPTPAAATTAPAAANVNALLDPTFSRKHPIPSEPHFGCIANIYDISNSLKITDVVEFVGVIGETRVANSFDELASGELSHQSSPTVPTLHVLFFTIPTKMSLPSVLAVPTSNETVNASLRGKLLAYLANSLQGDFDAAEWLLLSILARVHSRHPSGGTIGSLSLNLAMPPPASSSSSSSSSPASSSLLGSTKNDSIAVKLSSLVSSLCHLELTLPILNNLNTKFAPRSRDENLESGVLQLPKGTTVLVDMRGIGEGKLEDTGVRNLRYLSTTISQQKLAYEFPYTSFDFETDLKFILISEGRAIIPTDCVVYVQPSSNNQISQEDNPIPEAQLNQFRSLVLSMKDAEFKVPEEMSEVIQNDYVERRQKSVGGEGMSQEDLVFRLTAARLMALSYGKTTLDKEIWTLTADLDERRKDRIPKVKPTAQSALR